MDISSAIKQKRLLQFFYGGHTRTVEPHTYGLDAKGRLTLCGFQISGGSESGKTAGWKNFHVSEIQSGAILAEHFDKPRPEYERGDKAFTTIFAQL